MRFKFDTGLMLAEVETDGYIGLDEASRELSVPLTALLREFNHEHDEQAIPYPLGRWDDRRFRAALRS